MGLIKAGLYIYGAHYVVKNLKEMRQERSGNNQSSPQDFNQFQQPRFEQNRSNEQQYLQANPALPPRSQSVMSGSAGPDARGCQCGKQHVYVSDFKQ